MELRRATVDDIPLLQYWDTKPHVIAATGDEEGWDWHEELGRDPRWTAFYIGVHDDRPIGMVQIIDPANEETHYWGEVEPHQRALDIWIGEESDLGRGLGGKIMAVALSLCFDSPEVSAVLIDPLLRNTAAQRFYRRLGFEPVEERTFGNDHCLVMRLDRQAWQGRQNGPSDQ